MDSGPAQRYKPHPVKGLPKIAAIVLVVAITVLALLLFGKRPGIRAYSKDKRVRISDVQYLGENERYYSFIPPSLRLRLKFENLLGKIGIHSLPWKRFTPAVTVFPTPGPTLVVYGQIEISDCVLKLVSDRGDVLFLSSTETPFQPRYTNNAAGSPGLFSCDSALTNGTYHLRCGEETNDLAVIELRQ